MDFWTKAGFFLIGTGVGCFVGAFVCEKCLKEPIGEEEVYIPKESPEEDIPSETVTPEDDKEIKTINYIPIKDRNKNLNTDYSKYFVKDDVVEVNLAQEESPTEDYPIDDILEEDLITDRVEENFEVLLGDSHPNDYDTLIFYQEDYTLCDDREQLIPNPENVVGEVALTRLIEGGPGAENGTIFVRNLLTMITYEVVLDAGSYSETVLGIFEDRLSRTGGKNAGNR